MDWEGEGEPGEGGRSVQRSRQVEASKRENPGSTGVPMNPQSSKWITSFGIGSTDGQERMI